MDYMAILIAFAGGLGLFLYGMHTMAAGLQKLAGNKMKRIVEIITKNKFMGIIVGAFVTAIIQSSSATTVMVVGFVNAGIMSLSQSIGIIMGANIGTTVTGWLVSSVQWADFMKPTTLAPIAVMVGAGCILFSKKNAIKQFGEILVGFGILFLGIDSMTKHMGSFSDSVVFRNLFVKFGENPVLGILVGAIVTAILQSSSASVGILQALAMSGLVTFNSAVYIIMGQNIGTCVTALISGIGASKNAKAASYIHLFFNVVGSIVFSVIAYIYFTFINPDLGLQTISIVQISLVHTGFNIGNTVLMYPFSDYLVQFAEKLCKISKSPEDESFIHLDDRVLETPSIAIQSCIKEINRLGDMAYENLLISTECIMDKDKSKIDAIYKREDNIDALQEAISEYMIKICNANITEKENNFITSLFHTINDLERIGDYCENLADLTEFLIEENLTFSDIAKKEIEHISQETVSCVSNAISALKEGDISCAEIAAKEEAEIDEIENQLRAAHIKRLKNNECNPTTSVVYLDIITNLERISDHALNVAETVISVERNTPLSSIKHKA